MKKILFSLIALLSFSRAFSQTSPATPAPAHPQQMNTNAVYQDAVTKRYYVYNGTIFGWRQLPDTLQVAQMIANATGPSLTFGNGLTKTGSNVVLGGTLTQGTTVQAMLNQMEFNGSDGGNNSWSIRGNIDNRTSNIGTIELVSNDISSTGSRGRLFIRPDNVSISTISADGLSGVTLNLQNTGSSFSDAASKGLVYADDYSVNGKLDDRWIPDWGAVKSIIPNTSNFALLSGGNNFTGAQTVTGTGGNSLSNDGNSLTNPSTGAGASFTANAKILTPGVVQFSSLSSNFVQFNPDGTIQSLTDGKYFLKQGDAQPAFTLTNNSVPFWSGSNLTQDNTNFRWDNTNKRLVLGDDSSPGFDYTGGRLRLYVDKGNISSPNNFDVNINSYVRWTPTVAQTGLIYSGIHSYVEKAGSANAGILEGVGTVINANTTGTSQEERGFSSFIVNSNSGVVGSATHFLAISPSFSNGGTISTVYGVRVAAQQITGVTNGYAFYQDGTLDKNLFAGLSTFSGISTFSARADFSQEITVRGSNTPASGAGLELFDNGTSSFIQSYNRTTPGFRPLIFQGAGLYWSNSGGGSGTPDFSIVSGAAAFRLGITQTNANAYTTGGYSLLTRNTTSGRFETISQSDLATNAPVILATVTGINTKTTGSTALYTVPTGKTLIVTGVYLKCTAATAITVGAQADVGVAAGSVYTNANIAVTTATQSYQFQTGGVMTPPTAGQVLNLTINTAATGTSQTITAILVGYLI